MVRAHYSCCTFAPLKKKKTIKAIKEKSIKSNVVEGEEKNKLAICHSKGFAGLLDGFTCSVEQMIYGRQEVSAARPPALIKRGPSCLTSTCV